MAPPTLNVTKGRDGYILHWREEKMSYSHIACIFQVQYKKEGASWEVRDCAQGGAWRGGKDSETTLGNMPPAQMPGSQHVTSHREPLGLGGHSNEQSHCLFLW